VFEVRQPERAIRGRTGPRATGSGGSDPHPRADASRTARIFQGTPPGELPIQELHLSFAVNLKTARMLGVDVPPVVLARADEVID
jgi:hypothetical protein